MNKKLSKGRGPSQSEPLREARTNIKIPPIPLNLPTQTQSLFLYPKHNPDVKGNCSTCCGCVCSSLTGDPPEQAMPLLPAPALAAMPPRGHCSWAEQNSPAGTEHLPTPQPFKRDRNTSPGSNQAPTLILSPSGECQAPNVSHGTQDEVQFVPSEQQLSHKPLSSEQHQH